MVSAAGAGWYFGLGPGKRVAVPSVVGMTYDDAAQQLSQAGFTPTRTTAYSDDVAEGLVISTDPDADTRANPADPLTVSVSLGVEQVVVPDLTGSSADDAASLLSESRLDIVTQDAYSETVPAGMVISQDPAASTSVDHNSSVTVTISQGREPITVPTTSGLAKDDAVATIEAAGLVASVEEDYSTDVLSLIHI